MNGRDLTREEHRAEYARLLSRLVKSFGLTPSERDKWAPLVASVAGECNRHRAYALWMTERAADAHFGTVLELARDIAETPPGPFATVEELAVALGATVIGGGDGE